jgi:hypothetical protein
MLWLNEQFWHEKIKESGGPNISLDDYTIIARSEGREEVQLTIEELQALGTVQMIGRQCNSSWIPVPPLFPNYLGTQHTLESLINKGLLERPLIGTMPNGLSTWHVSPTQAANNAKYTATY